DVKLDGPHLGRRNEPLPVADKKVGLYIAVAFLDVDLLQFFGKSLAGMLLEEALPGKSLRAAHERKRTFAGNCQQTFTGGVIVSGQFVLGAAAGENLTIAAGQGNVANSALRHRLQWCAALGCDVR